MNFNILFDIKRSFKITDKNSRVKLKKTLVQYKDNSKTRQEHSGGKKEPLPGDIPEIKSQKQVYIYFWLLPFWRLPKQSKSAISI